jgi:hypothetical protein
MSEDRLHPGMIDRAGEAASEAAELGEQAFAALRDAADRFSAAVERAKQPGKPLDTMSRVTREAPLSALFVAFLIGVAVARRR